MAHVACAPGTLVQKRLRCSPDPFWCCRSYVSQSGNVVIDKPSYHLTFTCKVCAERSSHVVSKQAYHNGTVLIQCPKCKNRHLVADHLNIFGDKRQTLEDILAQKGETVLKRDLDLSKIGDLEWEK